MRVKCPACGHEHEAEAHVEPNPAPTAQRYTLTEIAGGLLPVTRDTLKRWIRTKRIHAYKLGGKGPWYIDAEYLEQWIKRNRDAGNAISD